MSKTGLFILFLASVAANEVYPQDAIAAVSATPAAVKTEKKSKDKVESVKPVANKLPGATPAPGQSNEPVTTQIYSDEAFFDSNKSMGIFSGRVKVTDPRFNLQSEKLTIFVTKGENQGLEKAIAEGNVAVVRDRPDPNGGPPTRAVGRSDTATYMAATGDVELKGTPRVQQGLNTHVATSPDTVMIINQKGELTTHGPSRTEIRQQPKDETKGATPAQPKGATPAQPSKGATSAQPSPPKK